MVNGSCESSLLWPSVVRLGVWLVADVAVVRLPILLPGTRTSAMPARQAPSIS
jgi:hypothetical protein